MYYICLNCGCEFDEPRGRTEVIGEAWGHPIEQTFYFCPYCGGDYEEEKNNDK